MEVKATTQNYEFVFAFLGNKATFTVPATSEKEAIEKLKIELVRMAEELTPRPR